MAAVWKHFQQLATGPERTLDQIIVMAVVEFDNCNDAKTEFHNSFAVEEAVRTVNIGGPFCLLGLVTLGKMLVDLAVLAKVNRVMDKSWQKKHTSPACS